MILSPNQFGIRQFLFTLHIRMVSHKDWKMLGKHPPRFNAVPSRAVYPLASNHAKGETMNTKAGILALVLTVFTLGLIGGVARAAMIITKPQDVSVVQPEEISEVTFQQVSKVSNVEAQPVQVAATATQAAIPAEQASMLALQAAGEEARLAAQPELVTFNGEAAYEVKLEDGNFVYIGAFDGTLKYNSITESNKPSVTSEQALIIAADYINYYQPVSITSKDYEGKPAYFIRFWNGANVFVDRAGTILAVQYIQYTNNSSSGTSASSGSSSNNNGESEHEEEDEHEGEDD
jgi:hypothetical protein